MSRSFEKKAAPVSMSKLLSHGYVEEKKKSPNDDDSSSTTKSRRMIVIKVMMMYEGGGVDAHCGLVFQVWPRNRPAPWPLKRSTTWSSSQGSSVGWPLVTSQTPSTLAPPYPPNPPSLTFMASSTDCFVLMLMQTVLSSFSPLIIYLLGLETFLLTGRRPSEVATVFYALFFIVFLFFLDFALEMSSRMSVVWRSS